MDTPPPSFTSTTPTTSQRLFPRERKSVSSVRSYVADTLAAWGYPDRLDDLRLCVSELATNALLHGVSSGRMFEVWVAADDTMVRVEIRDSGDGVPAPRVADVSEECGRGLVLVAALADDWGVISHAVGKTVWIAVKSRSPDAGGDR